MAELDLQYDLANTTPANATPVQANFSRIEQFVNQEVIRRDGTVAMVNQLKLAGNPQAALDAIPLQFLNAMLPIGVILMWSGDFAPAGGKWLIADGSSKAVADYPDLFNVYQYKWGGVPGGGNFNLPMGNGLMPISPGGSTGFGIGNKGGSKDAVLLNHTHVASHGHSGRLAKADTNHVHKIGTHTHIGTSDDGGAHGHGDPAWEARGFWYNQAGTGGFGGLGGGGGMYISGPWTNAPNHKHPFTTGDNTNRGGTNTEWQSSSQDVPGWGGDRYEHNHTLTIDDANYYTQGVFEGASRVDSLAGANMPPYATVNYIVRAL